MKIEGKYGEYDVEVYRNMMRLGNVPYPVVLVTILVERVVHHYWYDGVSAMREDCRLIDDAVYKVDCHGETPSETSSKDVFYIEGTFRNQDDNPHVTLEGACGSQISIDPASVTNINRLQNNMIKIVVKDIENSTRYNEFTVEGEFEDVCRKIYGGSNG